MNVGLQNMLPSVGSPSALLALPPFSTMNESLLTSGYVGRLVGAVAHPVFAPPALLVSSRPVLSPALCSESNYCFIPFEDTQWAAAGAARSCHVEATAVTSLETS